MYLSVFERKRPERAEGKAAMMGQKYRECSAPVQVSLEALVPADHFYRHLEKVLDLSFVREFVQEKYEHGGRPSIDPVVFWHRCNW